MRLAFLEESQLQQSRANKHNGNVGGILTEFGPDGHEVSLSTLTCLDFRHSPETGLDTEPITLALEAQERM